MAQKLTWLGHSAFHLRLGSGEVILFDPWTANPSAPPDFTLDRCDAILLSHGHSDHVGNTLEIA
ncbi:MAG: MBL fold metallo-hydrolase, partial [Bryobacteraceae bacterium]|nr:MBL fold metallo-hydrolase [Bryobacteraceae bacterium]